MIAACPHVAGVSRSFDWVITYAGRSPVPLFGDARRASFNETFGIGPKCSSFAGVLVRVCIGAAPIARRHRWARFDNQSRRRRVFYQPARA